MVFFAGPYWLGLDDKPARPKSDFTTRDLITNKEYKYSGNGHNWGPVGGTERVPQWYKIDKKQKEGLINFVKERKLVFGTNWVPPLKMVMGMIPQPKTIVFLTDGTSPSKPMDAVQPIVAEARKVGIKINTVALMEPKAREAMEYMAKQTSPKIMTMLCMKSVTETAHIPPMMV